MSFNLLDEFNSYYRDNCIRHVISDYKDNLFILFLVRINKLHVNVYKNLYYYNIIIVDASLIDDIFNIFV